VSVQLGARGLFVGGEHARGQFGHDFVVGLLRFQQLL
jgi:hypothetical protein